jgi:ubiquinone/menaquinone biosynthesis C-methylase UbiE
VLELVCGTGPWTEEPPRYVASVTAVDASPEVLKINRARSTQNHRLYAFGEPRA